MSWGRSCAGISADWVEIGARFSVLVLGGLGGVDVAMNVWWCRFLDGGDVGIEFSCEILCRTLLNSRCYQDDQIAFPLFNTPISSSV